MMNAEISQFTEESGMQDREFSIEDGYKILICFLPEFWWNFLKAAMIEKGLINEEIMDPEEHEKASLEQKVKDKLHDANDFFLDGVFLDLGGCGDYLEDIIEERMHIPPKQQHEGLRIKEDILFQLVIDWCNYFKKKFEGPPNGYAKDSIDFAIEWLEDMRKNPKDHNKEWKLWNKIIEEPRSGGWGPQSDFDTHIPRR